MIIGILSAIAVVAGVGLVIGIVLGIAGNRLAVKVDKKQEEIRDALPGLNCGACGFAGCDDLAAAIAKGESKANACPVGGEDTANAVAKITGESVEVEPTTAYVACGGDCDKAKSKYNYFGNKSCVDAATIPGEGFKVCDFGCLGLGSCVDVCDFNAISIENGVAVVDPDRCVSCGKCVNICPKGLITIVPKKGKYFVRCSSTDMPKDVNAACQVGCIGCGICVKACEFDAITVDNNVAVIDQEKCRRCGLCKMKCPKKAIQ